MDKPQLTDLYLLDTHALFQWITKDLSADFVAFIDKQAIQQKILVSSISFWEFGLLAKSGRLSIGNLALWKQQIVDHSHIQIISPSIDEMIASTLLPPHHKDPFDRLLIAQATANRALFVTQDKLIKKYDVKLFWKK